MRNCGYSQRGFTLIELLIALVVGGLLAGLVLNIFKYQTESHELQQEYVALEQNLRAAMEVITKDLRMTGLNLADIIAPLDVGDASGYLDLEGDDAPLNNESGAPTVLINDDPARNNSDALSIRRTVTNGQKIVSHDKTIPSIGVLNPSEMQDGQLFLLVRGDRKRWLCIKLRDVSTRFNITPAGAVYDRAEYDPAGPASFSNTLLSVALGTAYPLALNSYYIQPDTNTNDNINNSALMMVQNYGAPVVLAFGMTKMDVTYFEDTDSDPTTAPNERLDPTNITDIAKVRMVRITLTGQTQHPHKIGRNAPAFRTRTLTTTIKLRDMGLPTP